MARSAVVDIDLGYGKIKKDLSKLGKKYVSVGFQESAVTHYQSKGDRTQQPGVSVAQYAAYNEFGTATIPQRSFMRTAIDENINKLDDFVGQKYREVSEGKISIDQALGLIGQAVIGLIQRKIRQITQPPNAASTIKIKGSSKPLIDFGQMIQSVTYVIRSNK